MVEFVKFASSAASALPTALVASGPDLFGLDEWASLFTGVDAIDVVGDVVNDAATSATLVARSGATLAEIDITKVVDQHVRRLTALGPDMQYAMKKALLSAGTQEMNVTEFGNWLAANSPLSDGSAQMVARTELAAATNGGLQAAWSAGSVPLKRWMTVGDGRVRPDHTAASGQTVPVNMPFAVGGSNAMYPGDPRLPFGLRVNCRCYMTRVDANGKVRSDRLVDANRDDLYAMAKDLNIPGRSKMNKAELLTEIQRWSTGFGQQRVDEMTRSQLLHRARVADIRGRHAMPKQRLVDELVARNPLAMGDERKLLDAGYSLDGELSINRSRAIVDQTARRADFVVEGIDKTDYDLFGMIGRPIDDAVGRTPAQDLYLRLRSGGMSHDNAVMTVNTRLAEVRQMTFVNDPNCIVSLGDNLDDIEKATKDLAELDKKLGKDAVGSLQNDGAARDAYLELRQSGLSHEESLKLVEDEVMALRRTPGLSADETLLKAGDGERLLGQQKELDEALDRIGGSRINADIGPELTDAERLQTKDLYTELRANGAAHEDALKQIDEAAARNFRDGLSDMPDSASEVRDSAAQIAEERRGLRSSINEVFDDQELFDEELRDQLRKTSDELLERGMDPAAIVRRIETDVNAHLNYDNPLFDADDIIEENAQLAELIDRKIGDLPMSEAERAAYVKRAEDMYDEVKLNGSAHEDALDLLDGRTRWEGLETPKLKEVDDLFSGKYAPDGATGLTETPSSKYYDMLKADGLDHDEAMDAVRRQVDESGWAFEPERVMARQQDLAELGDEASNEVARLVDDGVDFDRAVIDAQRRQFLDEALDVPLEDFEADGVNRLLKSDDFQRAVNRGNIPAELEDKAAQFYGDLRNSGMSHLDAEFELRMQLDALARGTADDIGDARQITDRLDRLNALDTNWEASGRQLDQIIDGDVYGANSPSRLHERLLEEGLSDADAMKIVERETRSGLLQSADDLPQLDIDAVIRRNDELAERLAGLADEDLTRAQVLYDDALSRGMSHDSALSAIESVADDLGGVDDLVRRQADVLDRIDSLLPTDSQGVKDAAAQMYDEMIKRGIDPDVARQVVNDEIRYMKEAIESGNQNLISGRLMDVDLPGTDNFDLDMLLGKSGDNDVILETYLKRRNGSPFLDDAGGFMEKADEYKLMSDGDGLDFYEALRANGRAHEDAYEQTLEAIENYRSMDVENIADLVKNEDELAKWAERTLDGNIRLEGRGLDFGDHKTLYRDMLDQGATHEEAMARLADEAARLSNDSDAVLRDVADLLGGDDLDEAIGVVEDAMAPLRPSDAAKGFYDEQVKETYLLARQDGFSHEAAIDMAKEPWESAISKADEIGEVVDGENALFRSLVDEGMDEASAMDEVALRLTDLGDMQGPGLWRSEINPSIIADEALSKSEKLDSIAQRLLDKQGELLDRAGNPIPAEDSMARLRKMQDGMYARLRDGGLGHEEALLKIDQYIDEIPFDELNIRDGDGVTQYWRKKGSEDIARIVENEKVLVSGRIGADGNTALETLFNEAIADGKSPFDKKLWDDLNATALKMQDIEQTAITQAFGEEGGTMYRRLVDEGASHTDALNAVDETFRRGDTDDMLRGLDEMFDSTKTPGQIVADQESLLKAIDAGANPDDVLRQYKDGVTTMDDAILREADIADLRKIGDGEKSLSLYDEKIAEGLSHDNAVKEVNRLYDEVLEDFGDVCDI